MHNCRGETARHGPRYADAALPCRLARFGIALLAVLCSLSLNVRTAHASGCEDRKINLDGQGTTEYKLVGDTSIPTTFTAHYIDIDKDCVPHASPGTFTGPPPSGPPATSYVSISPGGYPNPGFYMITASHVFSDGLTRTSDARYIGIIKVDLDVDSDNNNGVAAPDRSQAEDDMEEAQPGKIVLVNYNDDDGDGIPDYADPQIAGEGNLVPLKVSIAGFQFMSKVRVSYSYDGPPSVDLPAFLASNPTDYTVAKQGTMRIWCRDDPGILRKPILYVVPNNPYTLDELNYSGGEKTHLIEGVNAAAHKVITLTVTYEGMTFTDSVMVSVVKADLDVDTDRDGTANDLADEPGEDAWTKTRGAIFSANFDRDGTLNGSDGYPMADAIRFDDTGAPVDEDFKIEDGPDDVKDIAPLVIRKMGTLPTNVKVFMKVTQKEDIQSIHVYKKIAAKEPKIWGSIGDRAGGAQEPLEVDITKWVDAASSDFAGDSTTGDCTFGVEGLFFKNSRPIIGFDGEIDLTLELRWNAQVIASDKVHVKVAPWMMLPNHLQTDEVWVSNNGSLNVTFRETPPPPPKPEYVSLNNVGTATYQETTLAGISHYFLQDHAEIGFYHRPGGPKNHCAFKLPAPQERWLEFAILKKDVGLFQLGQNLGVDAGSKVVAVNGLTGGGYGGNLEILAPPPGAHQLGKIVVGSTRPDKLWDFLDSQEVQPPFEVPTQWLEVGHIDEVFLLTEKVSQIVVADPTLAFSLLEDQNVVPDRGRAVFFAVGDSLPQTGKVSAGSVGSSDLRIRTAGEDHTGQPWRYIRFYSGFATGQVGEIDQRDENGDGEPDGLGNGYIEVVKVWDTLSGISRDTMFKPPAAQNTWARAPQVNDSYVLVEGSKFWVGGVPAIVTVEEVLNDGSLKSVNKIYAQHEIDNAKKALGAAGAGLSFMKVPVIYVGRLAGFSKGRSAIAFTPGLANAQTVAGKIYFPRQWGPRNQFGDDIFEKATTTALANAQFVDDWDWYHRGSGEVHCGTLTKNKLWNLDWWDP